MARTAGASSMSDIRSIAVLYDAEATQPRPPYRLDIHALPLRTDRSFDSTKSWNLLICSFGLSGMALGVLHSCVLFARFATATYDLTNLQSTIVSAGTYAAFLIMSPIGCLLVKCWSPRHAATCGLLLGFSGLTLIALELHKILHVVGYIVCIGTGCSFVQTAANSCIIDFFKKHLSKAIIIMSLSSPIGTLMFTAFTYFIGINGLLAFKWVMLCYAMLFVAAIGITRRLPHSIRIPGHRDPIRAAEVAQKVKDCLKRNKNTVNLESMPKKEYACTCSCIIDCSIMKDTAFYLWGGICFCAMLSFYIPFVCLVAYLRLEFNFGYEIALRFIGVFCVTSMLSRICVSILSDFGFIKTRTILQLGLVANAILYLSMNKATTFGWVISLCIGFGLMEGVFVILIPRMTLLIFPTKNVSAAWQLLVALHGLAVFTGSTIFVILGGPGFGGDILLPCVFIGTFQIIAAILAFLLPKVVIECKQNQNPSSKKRLTLDLFRNLTPGHPIQKFMKPLPSQYLSSLRRKKDCARPSDQD